MLVALHSAAFAAPTAEVLFEQGQAAFAKDDFATAAAKWKESYALSKEPELLFNIAQAIRLNGECEEALATYRRYVAKAPEGEQGRLADEFIRELAAKCDDVGHTTRESKLRVSKEQPRDVNKGDARMDTKTIAGLAIAGAGVVSVVAGLYYGDRASTLGEEVRDACPGTDGGAGCNWGVLADKEAEGRSAETKQYAFIGIGAAAIVGGGILCWFGSREQPDAPVAIAPERGGAMITWSGLW